MKTHFIIFILLISILSCKTNNPKTNILESKNISEITEYLRTAHPDDPKKYFLKQKLVTLKNASWTKSGQGVPMPPRPLENYTKTFERDDSEFKRLMEESKKNHNTNTVNILNQLFNNDVESTQVIILVQNKSDCNMVIHIEGKSFHSLPVPMHGENSLVIDRGNYQLNATLCDVKYTSNKTINKNLLLTLSNL